MANFVTLHAFLIGTGAGLASALLFAALVGGSVAALPLFVASPLPLMLAGLASGPFAGFVGGVVALVALEAGLGTPAAAVALAIVALPAAVLSRLSVRSVEVDDETRRTSVGVIATQAAVLTAIATLAGAIAIGFDPVATTNEVMAAFRVAAGEGGTTMADLPDPTLLQPFVYATVRLMPSFFPAFWALVLIVDLVVAVKLLARFGRRVRPAEDLALIEPPIAVGLVFAAGFAAAFLPGTPGILAEIAAGAAFAPLFLTGMGLLTVVTRGSDMRWIVRATAYGLVLLFPIAALAMAFAGLAELFATLRRRRPPHAGQ